METKHGVIMCVVFTAAFSSFLIWLESGPKPVSAKPESRIGTVLVAPKQMIGLADLEPGLAATVMTLLTFKDSGDASKRNFALDGIAGLEADGRISYIHSGNRLRVTGESGPMVRVRNLSERTKSGAREFWLHQDWLIASPTTAAAKRKPESSY